VHADLVSRLSLVTLAHFECMQLANEFGGMGFWGAQIKIYIYSVVYSCKAMTIGRYSGMRGGLQMVLEDWKVLIRRP